MDASSGTVLLTGATGFIGRHVARALLAKGVDVHAVSRTAGGDQVVPGARWWQADLRETPSVRAVVAAVRPTTVVHLAGCAAVRGQTDWAAFEESLAVNLHGALALLESLLDATWPLKRVVCAGGLEEYGNGPVPFVETQREQPVSAYSAVQVALSHSAQMLHRQRGLPCVILRLGLVYGPEQADTFMIPALIEACLAHRPFPMTDGVQTRDYVYVDDVVEAVVRAATADGVDGCVINVSEGVERRVADVADRIVALAGGGDILRLGALPPREGQVRRMVCDSSRARRLLGWRATTPFDTGLQATIRWQRQHAAAVE